MAHPYYNMSRKPDKFRSTYVSSTYESTYRDAADYLSGHRGGDWQGLRLGDQAQGALLLGLSVTGVECSDWPSVFRLLKQEAAPFVGLARGYMSGQLQLDWSYFAAKLAKETSYAQYLPPVCPEYLFAYGVAQQPYLAALAVYWDNVHDDYYKPWATTRLGGDSPEMARLKQLGEAARREIDQVARHGASTLKR